MLEHLHDTVVFDPSAIANEPSPDIASMKGVPDDEVDIGLAEHLQRHVTLSKDSQEAFRMANQQNGRNRAATLRMATEMAMRDLLRNAA